MPLFRHMNRLFGEVFEEPETYHDQPPSNAYALDLLSKSSFLAIVAIEQDQVIGAGAGYRHHKFEMERSEIFIYDLAVATRHQQRGIGTAILREYQHIAHETDAWTVNIASDHSDPIPTALYGKLGVKEQANWFDLPPIPR